MRTLAAALLIATLCWAGGQAQAADAAGTDTSVVVADSHGPRDWWADKSPQEKKVVATNVAVAGFIAAWGFAYWDYGSQAPHAKREGWFAPDTKEGGADKGGHLYAGYVMGRAFSGLFRGYGYDPAKVARAGALSSLAATSFMEIGDSFSAYGFSYEDMVMNVAGAGTAWLLAARPSLGRKFAMRGEYDPFATSGGDILTDYDNWRYYATVKLDGFERMPRPLRWIELHAGYCARGYSDADPANDRRYTFVGIGISLPKLAQALGWQRTATFLDYYQPPGTVARDDRQH